MPPFGVCLRVEWVSDGRGNLYETYRLRLYSALYLRSSAFICGFNAFRRSGAGDGGFGGGGSAAVELDAAVGGAAGDDVQGGDQRDGAGHAHGVHQYGGERDGEGAAGGSGCGC